jgi:ribosomal protein L29
MLKKKKVVITPETKLLEAGIHVEAQQAHFKKMIEEVEYAKGLRAEAIEELDKEIASLEAQLARKKAMVENAHLQNQADDGFIKKLNEMIGL